MLCAVGTLMSCLIGCIVRVPLGHVLWVGGPLAVAISLSAMQLTGTIHPPGDSAIRIAASALPVSSLLEISEHLLGNSTNSCALS